MALRFIRPTFDGIERSTCFASATGPVLRDRPGAAVRADLVLA
jgi:hypothetical protein